MTSVSEALRALGHNVMTVEAAWREMRSLGTDLRYDGRDDDLDPDGPEDDDPDDDDSDWPEDERGYLYTDGLGIDDGDESISDIGEGPSGLGRYCELCGNDDGCDCADTVSDELAVSTPFVAKVW